MATMKRDSKGHMLAAWDEHIACRNCLRQIGIHCTRAMPCQVCSQWDEATWQCQERAIQEKERRKAKSVDSSSSEAQFHSPQAKKSESTKKGKGSGNSC